MNSFHVCITSYKLLMKDQSHFLRRRWSHLVLDEVQLLKSMSEKHWETIFTIKRSGSAHKHTHTLTHAGMLTHPQAHTSTHIFLHTLPHTHTHPAQSFAALSISVAYTASHCR